MKKNTKYLIGLFVILVFTSLIALVYYAKREHFGQTQKIVKLVTKPSNNQNCKNANDPNCKTKPK